MVNIEPKLPTHAPFDEQAEKYVIGGCLADYRVFPSVSSIVKPSDFFIKRHEYIFKAMQDLFYEGEDIDVPMVVLQLKKTQGDNGEDLYDLIGGEPYLLYLEQSVEYSNHHYEVFAYTIKRHAVQLKVLEATDKMRGLAMRNDLSLSTLQNETFIALETAYQGVIEKPAPTIGDAVKNFSERLYLIESSEGVNRLYTGYPEVDNPTLIGGFRRNDLVILGGDTGMGKTSLIMNFAINFSLNNAIGLFISKEMDEDEMSRRIIAVMGNIPLIKLRGYTENEKKQMAKSFIEAVTQTDEERVRFGQTIRDIQKLPLLLKHIPNPTPIDVWSEARRVKQTYGRLDYLVVDLITDMPADEPDRASTRALELGNMAGRFKEMAAKKNLDCTVFVLAQVTPNIRNRNNKRPMKGDFRDSSAIGNQADVQMFFYRDSEYNDDAEFPEQAELIVRKNRDGKPGTALLHWTGETTKVRGWAWFTNIYAQANRVIDS